MARIKYDNSDVEAGGGGNPAPPGLYNGFIAGIEQRKKKKDGTPANDLEVVVDVGKEYARLWTYIPLDPDASNKWKFREFTDALGLPAKGLLPELKTLVKKKVGVRVKGRSDGDGSEIKNLLLPVDDDQLSVPSGDDDGGDTGDDGDTNYEEWEDSDLKEELAERDLKIAGRFTRDKAIAALQEFDGPGADDDGEEEDGDGDFDITTVEGYEDFADWSVDDLKEELKTNSISVEGRFSEGKARQAIIDFLAESGNGDGPVADESEAPADEDTYDDENEWPTDDLKAEVTERNEQGAEIKIAGRATREKLIAALREDDKAAAGDPF